MNKNNITTPLDKFYKWENEKGNEDFLIQPINGNYISYTWNEVGVQARKIANKINSLNLKKNSKIAIISKNCAHWIIADLAIMMSGHISVPIYANVNAETTKYILNHSESKLVFIGKLEESDWKEIKKGIPNSINKINFGYYDLSNTVGIETWEDVINSHSPINDSPKSNLDEIFSIIYTSGTTGIPKGVVLKFYSASLATQNLNNIVPLEESERFFSYLPLSHIAERALVEFGGIFSGGTISFAESLDTFSDNLKYTKPTIFFGVPRIWSKFMSGILSKFSQNTINLILSIPILNSLFKAIIQKALGLNKARICITGAAAIPVSTLDWYKKLGILVYEAYGMTENAACSHGNYPNNIKFGYVGKAMPNTDVKITEKGEVIMKNGCVMEGYYKEPEKTKEVIKNGYLYTGDKGEIDQDGFLKITGRVKDIFKTSKGKYVAPNPIEMKFSKNKDIEQICIAGMNLIQPIALIVLSENANKENKLNLEEKLIKTLENVNQQIDKHEQIEKIIIMKDAWTTENNILTPTMKIKRSKLDSMYEKEYPKWYEMPQKVIWE